MPPERQDPADALYTVPLRSFVAERKRVAQALKQAGRRDEAKAVEKLTRPTVSVWTVNQIARREPQLVRKLGALTADLQGAHGPRFTEVMKEHRALLGVLRDKAEAVLAADGHATAPQLLARVVSDLRAGVADADTRPLIESGRLARDVEETGFETAFAGDGGGAPPPPVREHARPREKPPTDDKEARRRDEAARREREAAERRERHTLARAVEKARAAQAAAAKTLERREREQADARRRADEAEQAAADARRERDRLAQELARAEEALRRAGGDGVR